MYQSYQLSHALMHSKLLLRFRQNWKGQKGAAVGLPDAQGELIAFLRTDGCRLPSINIAINKAFTAARKRKESAKIGQSSRDNISDEQFRGCALYQLGRRVRLCIKVR